VTTNVVKVAMQFSVTPPPDFGYPLDVVDGIALTWHAHAVDSHAPPDDDNLTALANIGVTWWDEGGPVSGAALKEAYNTQYKLVDVSAWRVRPTLSDPVVILANLPGANIPNEPAFPPQNAYLVGLRTIVASRNYRGRMYFPPFAQGGGASVSGGLSDELLRTVARRCADLVALVAAYEAPPEKWALCVYSRVDLDSHAVTHFEIPRHVRTQRRRAFTPTTYRAHGLDGEPA